MKNYLITVMQEATSKFIIGNKLYSIGSLLILLSSESNSNNMKIELSFAIFLFVLILGIAIHMIYRNPIKQKTAHLTESEKLK
jgi:multisubunit Na+/H+ antiporter MnhG subunit